MQPAYMFYQICTNKSGNKSHIQYNVCTVMGTNLKTAWKVESAQSKF